MAVKTVYVGRHTLLPAQIQAVEALGLEVVERIENLPNDSRELHKLITELKQKGIQAVLTVALPPHLLATLSSAFDLYILEMQSSTMQNITEAEKWVNEKPQTRTYLPGRPGEPVRILEFKGINKIKVIINSERVYTVP